MAARNPMETIRRSRIAKGTAGLWWLGQSSFILKSPGGITMAVDPYLTDSCHKKYPDAPVNVKRAYPVPIKPGDLMVDAFLTTHSHCDHTDEETIARLTGTMRKSAWFIGPAESVPVFREHALPGEHIIQFWPNREFRVGDVTITGTFALPTDDTDLNHMGYLFTFPGNLKVYITGDTAWTPLLKYARRYRPHCMCVCINGGFNQIGPWNAAELTMAVNPKMVIPTHWDLFPGNSVPPEVFEDALKLEGYKGRYLKPEHMKKMVVKK